MNSQHRVLVLGSVNMDIVVSAPRHPKPGETVPGTRLSYSPGGKGANQAVAAARSGATTCMVGVVGDDAFGLQLVRFLADNGVDVTHVGTRVGTSTGTALIVVEDGGENSIVVVPGANGTVEMIHRNDLALVRGDILLAQFETPIDATMDFFRAGRSLGATCVLNPAPAGAVPRDLLELVDLLIVNQVEFAKLTGKAVSSGDHEWCLEGFEFLKVAGLRGNLVVTLGAGGVAAVIGDQVVAVPGHKVSAVDTTGAGDCFVGNLAAQLVGGAAIEDALRLANAAAALSTTRPGAGPSMPYAAEVRGVAHR